MHAVDLLDAEAIHQPVVDHRLGAGTALLRRLKNHHCVAGEIAGLGEIACRAEQHRGVTVMAAGMHLARRLGGVGQIGLFLDRQRIHVGAQADHLDVAIALRLAALDDADHPGAAKTGGDFVAAEFTEPVRHECCSAMHVVEQLRVLMDITAPGLNIGLKVGDTIDDGHEMSRLEV